MRFILLCCCLIIWACSTPNKPVEGLVLSESNGVDSTITLDFLMGKFDPKKDSRFVDIPIELANRAGHMLQKDASDALIQMIEAAKKDSVNLKVISTTRNFDVQKSIWEAKWTGERKVEGGQNLAETVSDPVERALIILKFSSMPGTSRHHWGSDLDINALTNSYFESGKGLIEYQWLVKHASKFGFCQPYTKKGTARPYGYNEEKWHWSYLPLAKQYTEQISLRLKDSMIEGFLGAETAVHNEIVDRYILGINNACK